MPQHSVPDMANFPQPSHSIDSRLSTHNSPVVPDTVLEVRRQIRESLGLSVQEEGRPTIPMEAHLCEYPIWAYSKQSAAVTSLHIGYEDGSFVEIDAPKGFPSVTSPGYLDVLLYYGQRDLFRESYVEMSAYSILKHLGLDPRVGGNRERFIRDMERHFALRIKTDRFLNPTTGTRTHVAYFRVLNSMELAKRQEGVSRFYFNELFLRSLRSGYLRRLDMDFCLYLDKAVEPLARFLYSHIMKRLGEKSLYSRTLPGFLTDVGLGHVAKMKPWRRNEALKRTVYPAMEFLKGQAFSQYELDGNGIFRFFPKGD
jgi:hypothetical protein